MTPQAQTLLTHLKTIGDISPLEARSVYRIDSLSRRICDLKDAGHNIGRETKRDATGKRYVRYTLVG